MIFGYLLYRIGPGKLWGAVRSVHVSYFLGALPIFFAMIGVKTLKMRMIMRSPMSFSELYDLNAFAFSIGAVTPGRLGEFSKIIFLSKRNVPVAESFTITLIDRLADVSGMIVCAIFGLHVFFGAEAGRMGLAGAVVLMACGMAFWFSDRFLRFVTRGKWRELVDMEGNAIRSYVRRISVPNWIGVISLTIVYLGLYFLQMWILAVGLHSPISYLQTTMAISAAAIPAILPVSFFNVGPRDAVLAAIFSRMGWGAEGGVALSTLILFLFLINGLFGLFFLPRKDPA